MWNCRKANSLPNPNYLPAGLEAALEAYVQVYAHMFGVRRSGYRKVRRVQRRRDDLLANTEM